MKRFCKRLLNAVTDLIYLFLDALNIWSLKIYSLLKWERKLKICLCSESQENMGAVSAGQACNSHPSTASNNNNLPESPHPVKLSPQQPTANSWNEHNCLLRLKGGDVQMFWPLFLGCRKQKQTQCDSVLHVKRNTKSIFWSSWNDLLAPRS